MYLGPVTNAMNVNESNRICHECVLLIRNIGHLCEIHFVSVDLTTKITLHKKGCMFLSIFVIII